MSTIPALKPKNPAVVFSTYGPPTMAEIRELVASQLTGTKRRDSLSAFKTAASVLGVDWASVRATPHAIRELLGQSSAAELGLTENRWRNVRSLIVGAVRMFGSMPNAVNQRIPHSSTWEALLDRIPKKHWRHALNRLASFCSALQITPEGVTSQTLRDFYQALVVEELLRHPRKKLKHTIACWNMCQSNIPNWPNLRLSSPFESTSYKLPSEAFPASFSEDLQRWQRRLVNPDVMDPDAPIRPLKQVTVDGHSKHIIRFASALIHRGVMAPDEIIDLVTLVANIEHFKEGLRFFLERSAGKPTAHIANMANVLRAVAKHYVRASEDHLEQLDQICKRLRPERPTGMTDRNRAKLRQFDDPEKVAALLNFPAAEAKRGRELKNVHRAAKCFERGVAAALLIATGIRIKNLRTIELQGDLTWINKTGYLSIPADRVKNGVPLDFELPEETAGILREYIDCYRPVLPGSEGIYLFPAGDGGPRAHSTMATDLMSALRKRAGLRMNAHLFRHTIAKIVIERDPGHAFTISRHLGHKRIDTTMQSYLGTEGRAVGRRIDSVISAARRNPALPVD